MKVALEKRDFEMQAYWGLKKYGESDKRVEFLTLTITKDKEVDLFSFFEKLNERMLYKGRFGIIDFAGVMVDGQHIHTLIRKPYVKTNELLAFWKNVTGEHSSMMIKTVRKDKTKASQMAKLIAYILNQGEKHNTDDILFFQSQNWGIVSSKDKEYKKLKKSESSKITMLKKHAKALRSDEPSELSIEDSQKIRDYYEVKDAYYYSIMKYM